MSRALRRGAALLALACLAGCSTLTPEPFPEGEDRAFLSGQAERVGVGGRRILLVPLPERRLPAPEAESRRGPIRYEAAALTEELRSALERVIGEGSVEVAPVDSASAGRYALEQGHELILRVEPRRWNSAFLQTTGWWYPNALFVGWYFWPVGAWVIADELYGIDCELELDLRETTSEVALTGLDRQQLDLISPLEEPREEPRPSDPPPLPRVVLSDGERGLDFFGTWVPGDLDPDQWAEVGAALAPYARRHAALRVASAVADALCADAALTPEQREARYATAHAVVVGLGDYPSAAGGPCLGAKADAEGVAAFLRGELAPLPPPGAQREPEPLSPWLPAKNLRVLLNAEAAAGASEGTTSILEHVKAAAARARPQDALVVSLAGRGRLRAGAGLAALELVDLSGRALSLASLGEAIQASPAKRRLIVLDLDFRAGPRGLAPEQQGLSAPSAGELSQALRAWLHPSGSGAVILASDLGEGAQAHSFATEAEDEQGLLTRYVLQGLRGEADAGEDGLTFADLGGYLERHVRNLSSVALGSPQRPLIVAHPASALVRK